MTHLLEQREVEARAIAHLAQVFPKLRVEPYPNDFQGYKLSGAPGALLVLCQTIEHPGARKLCLDPDCPSFFLGNMLPRVEVAVIVVAKDDAERMLVSRLLAELRVAMSAFQLPVPEGAKGDWLCRVEKESFLEEDAGEWFYGTAYGITFHEPEFAARTASTSQGVSA